MLVKPQIDGCWALFFLSHYETEGSGWQGAVPAGNGCGYGSFSFFPLVSRCPGFDSDSSGLSIECKEICSMYRNPLKGGSLEFRKGMNV